MGQATTVTAELRGVKSRLGLAWDWGFCEVILEFDSKLVFHFLSSHGNGTMWNRVILEVFNPLSLAVGRLPFSTRIAREINVWIA